MNSYPQYKPLRNLLRQYNLRGSLEDLWWYFQAVDHPTNKESVWTDEGFRSLKSLVFKWEISILAREIVLHAAPNGKLRMRPWNGMANAINTLRRVGNEMAIANMTPESSFNSLNPIGHQQFPWQRQRLFNSLMRHFKVFSAPDVERLVVRETGVSTREWFFVGFAAAGLLNKEPAMSIRQDYRAFDIELERSDTILEKLSQPLADLREQIVAAARHDETWAYTWNPLEARPLVSLDPMRPERMHCPIPHFVIRRASQGLFYDIARAEGFNNPFGASFQAYFGDVLSATFSSPKFTISEERVYHVGRDRKDGVDWILADETGSLFVECKAKRMTVGAKSSIDPLIIGQQVEFLAKAVIQLYKNIADALEGHTHWAPNGLAIYPLVVTLEDWYLFGPAAGLLAEGVRVKMEEANLDLSWLDSMPYTVTSCAEFEEVSPTIGQVGIEAFFNLKHSGDQRGWMLREFANEQFGEVYQRTCRRDLFKHEWVRILPENVLPFKVPSAGEV
ncbi:hypothetical protein LJR129_004914 [Acidovorax sp. LjRoot129]|uniref:hypothetical protein n=1 Tax=unclassified Acidovorax TaxID=2684926 RepID=UPI003ECD1128